MSICTGEAIVNDDDKYHDGSDGADGYTDGGRGEDNKDDDSDVNNVDCVFCESSDVGESVGATVDVVAFYHCSSIVIVTVTHVIISMAIVPSWLLGDIFPPAHHPKTKPRQKNLKNNFEVALNAI